MKTSALLLSLVPAIWALDPRATACKAGNNCQRGVGGTNGKPALNVRLADCASFLSVTVTPPASTTTILVEGSTTQTTTTTTYYTNQNYGVVSTTTFGVVDPSPVAPTKRAVTESQVPAYATYCPNPSAYASACACAGATQATTEAPTPIVTEYAAAVTQTVRITDCQVMNAVRARGMEGLADMIDYVFH